MITAGHFPSLRVPDPPTANRPPIVLSGWAPKPKATAVAARTFDGVFIGCELTVEATANICRRLREACERIGRDPQSLTIYNTMLCAPDLSPDEELAQMNARMITHSSFPSIGNLICEENGWGPEAMREILGHEELRGDTIADQTYRRDQLLELGGKIPREWVESGCAVGSSAQVVSRLREYLDAGLDHLLLHGSHPHQLTEMIKHWRERQATPSV